VEDVSSAKPDNLDPIAAVVDFVHNTRAVLTTTSRQSRKDKHLHSSFWPLRFYSSRPPFSGVVTIPALPPFPYHHDMSSRRSIPATPRVISPSPTPSELGEGSSQDSYFGPTTRSAAKKQVSTPQAVEEHVDEDDLDSNPELRRSRTRSRSPIATRRMSGLTPVTGKGLGAQKKSTTTKTETLANGKTVVTNGHLAPSTPATSGWSWRDFSRSPSPLGLIPIHRHWRIFVHRHEVPRKVLHVSIGFLAIWLYLSGTQTRAVCPYLMGALIPITTVDYVRHHYAPFNRFYVRVLGAFMRESEFDKYNGVIFYMLGAWLVLYFLPKDVGVVATLLLSWCDTAASTFGRLYGRYTPRLRRGKSLAGSAAALSVGVATAAWFWGYLAPKAGPMPGDEHFMFKGTLALPGAAARALGLSQAQATISGGLALAVMSLWSGFAAAVSEVIDVFGWDDNLTIPVLSGAGIWGFLKVFG
jgi:diacylglycerol kinase (CTP)